VFGGGGALQSKPGLDCLNLEVPRSKTITHTHTVGRTPLHERSARRKNLYLKSHNTHKK
jgi:hypothetical protein